MQNKDTNKFAFAAQELSHIIDSCHSVKSAHFISSSLLNYLNERLCALNELAISEPEPTCGESSLNVLSVPDKAQNQELLRAYEASYPQVFSQLPFLLEVDLSSSAIVFDIGNEVTAQQLNENHSITELLQCILDKYEVVEMQVIHNGIMYLDNHYEMAVPHSAYPILTEKGFTISKDILFSRDVDPKRANSHQKLLLALKDPGVRPLKAKLSNPWESHLARENNRTFVEHSSSSYDFNGELTLIYSKDLTDKPDFSKGIEVEKKGDELFGKAYYNNNTSLRSAIKGVMHVIIDDDTNCEIPDWVCLLSSGQFTLKMENIKYVPPLFARITLMLEGEVTLPLNILGADNLTNIDLSQSKLVSLPLNFDVEKDTKLSLPDCEINGVKDVFISNGERVRCFWANSMICCLYDGKVTQLASLISQFKSGQLEASKMGNSADIEKLRDARESLINLRNN